MNTELLAAAISAFGTVVAALIGGLIGIKWLRQQGMVEQLKIARRDIRFLLEVERLHTEAREPERPLRPLRQARSVCKERGFSWSGRNTKSRVDEANA